MTELVAVRLGGDGSRWRALGFDVVDAAIRLSNGAIEFVGDRSADDQDSLVVRSPDVNVPIDVDGVRVVPATTGGAGRSQPNGALSLDHLVVMTDSLERTSDAFADRLGLARRRVRETSTVRQAFHRFADPVDPAGPAEAPRGCIVEIVENPKVRRVGLWGVVVIVDDLDALCADHPDLVGPPREAVQPGRRIATARREADLATAVAFMTP